MKTRLLATAVACALAATAQAQTTETRQERRIVIDGHDILAEASAARASADAWRQWGDDLRASLGTLYGDHFVSAKPVKGAPYSAEVSTEVSQTLADGNVISRKTSGRVFRDGEGRTRQETVVNGEAKSIQLRDPVEGSSVMLLPGSKKVVRMPRVDVAAGTKELKVIRLGDREIRIENGKVSLDGREVPGPVELKAGGKEIRIDGGKVTIDGKDVAAGAGGQRVTVKRIGEADTGDGTRREEVRVHVVRSGGGEVTVTTPPVPPVPPVPPSGPVPPVPPVPPMPPMMGMLGSHLDGALLKSKGVTASLGVKEFDGVKAEGKSTLHTIPAGEIGNRNPIQVTRETWYSPELQVTVYSRQSDPRYGETVYRLTNIRRGEPPADLFKVPEDYSGGKRGKG